MIILGIVLLIIGFIAKIAILWTIGIIVLVIGAILALLATHNRASKLRQQIETERAAAAWFNHATAVFGSSRFPVGRTSGHMLTPAG